MQLEGWVNPLPEYIVKAIEAGVIKVEQAKGFQFLLGTVTNPEGTVIKFF